MYRKRTTSNTRHGRIGMWILIAVMISLVVAFTIGIFGRVSGEEFSPQKFAIRRFHYVQIPFLRWQILPVRFDKTFGRGAELTKHIKKTTRQSTLMKSVAQMPVRWDIMSMQQMGAASQRGDASILTNYLRQPGAKGMESWLEWSTANPQLSSELWSLVAFLASQDLYPIIPEILEAARRIDSSNFRHQLREIVVKECSTFAEAYDALNEAQRARDIRQIIDRIDAGTL